MSRQPEIIVAETKLGKPVAQEHMGTGGTEKGFEAVAPNDLTKNAIELEAFMNETLVVLVAESSNQEDLDYVKVDVNDNHQIFIRGAKTHAKRKYVEALARSTDGKIIQKLADPGDKASLQNIPKVSNTYPFVILHDPNPKGREWIKRILAERV